MGPHDHITVRPCEASCSWWLVGLAACNPLSVPLPHPPLMPGAGQWLQSSPPPLMHPKAWRPETRVSVLDSGFILPPHPPPPSHAPQGMAT